MLFPLALKNLISFDIISVWNSGCNAYVECMIKCGQKEVIGEILLEIYSHSHAEELYALFSKDNFLKIRLLADKIFGKISMDET